ESAVLIGFPDEPPGDLDAGVRRITGNYQFAYLLTFELGDDGQLLVGLEVYRAVKANVTRRFNLDQILARRHISLAPPPVGAGSPLLSAVQIELGLRNGRAARGVDALRNKLAQSDVGRQPKGARKIGRRLEAIERPFGKRLQDDVLDRLGDVRAYFTQRAGQNRTVHVHHLPLGIGYEWDLTGQHLIENDAEAVDVRALVDRAVSDGLFRRDVIRRPRDARIGPDPDGRAEHLGNAEVEDADALFPVFLLDEHDVARFQVAVDDPFPVSVCDRLGDLLQEYDHALK